MHKGELDSDIQYLPGVGPRRAAALKKEYAVETVGDLLRVYPFRYVDRSRITPISQLNDSASQQILAKVIKSELIGGKRLSVTVEDSSGRLELVFFKGIKYTMARLEPGKTFLFYGKPAVFNGVMNMVHPDIDYPPGADDRHASYTTGVMTGIYPSGEGLKSAGITAKAMNKLMENAIRLALPEVRETLPEYLMQEAGLVPIHFALRNIHFPQDAASLSAARRRICFEELFFLQLSLLKQKYIRSRGARGYVMNRVGDAFNRCYEALPYSLTGAQKRVIREIREDMRSGRQMNRLLQGDVGSGKTMVAVLSSLIAVGNAYQACLMAPTEVLARQHFANMEKYLAPTGVKVAVLTGSTRQAQRREILAGLADGSISIVVGTHALIEDKVVFYRLGLAIVDEQHRFGVDQRAALWSKTADGIPPHVLVMTATPIPRTLAMTLYGDLDISVIDELPPGRKPVQTLMMTESRRAALNRFLKEQIALGRQVFIVYPLIFESEKLDLKNLEEGYDRTCDDFPLPDYKVAIVHGKQTNEEKEFNMSAFAQGRADILVSTTVIEVGVDVPNASVMVIESAERFGLSQLHQLRGRVGRGSDKSYCVLVRGDKLSRESSKRLELLCSTEDGFLLAEEDMKMRGPGDMEGTQQSGLPVELRLASLVKDGPLLNEARRLAESVLERDPDLGLPENALLREELRKDRYKMKDYSKIS